jgi:hypothetical protein
MLHAATERPEGRDWMVWERRLNPGTSGLNVSDGSPQGAPSSAKTTIVARPGLNTFNTLRSKRVYELRGAFVSKET